VSDTSKELVYLCQPGYGNGLKDSKRQFWARAFLPDDPWLGRDSADDYGNSLLPDAFNTHWRTALNYQLAGANFTRFVMLHDDVVPEDGWAGKLLRLLDETGADVVSAVIPIKDSRGLTSTALDDVDDPWEVYRRLTLHEVWGLGMPETFTAADCAVAFGETARLPRPLLVNTGCWACRLDRPWRFRVDFRLDNRITFVLSEDYTMTGTVSPPCEGTVLKAGTVLEGRQYTPGMRGQFTNQCMSEDWDFSRQLARLGCDVRATRAVRLTHGGGPFPCPNYPDDGGQAWGSWKDDESLRRKHSPPLPAKEQPPAATPAAPSPPTATIRPYWPSKELPDVGGWLSDEEGRALAALAAGKRVLEVGSYKGRSTIWMARTADRVDCIDTFDTTGTTALLPRKNTYFEFCENVRRHGVADKMSVFMTSSARALARAAEEGAMYDLVFIDADHSYEAVKRDAALAFPLLAPGGCLVFHDYGSPADPGVAKAVHELGGLGWFAKLPGTLIQFTPGEPPLPQERHNGERQAQPEPGPAPAAARGAAVPPVRAVPYRPAEPPAGVAARTPAQCPQGGTPAGQPAAG
jgi:predicted O-methyltransferase YrrM